MDTTTPAGHGGPTGQQLTLPRRRFLVGAAATLALAACSENETATPETTSTTTIPTPPLAGDPFLLGVASGDPLEDAVVIWTRLAVDLAAPDLGLPTDPVPVRWEVARDDAFDDVVTHGIAVADPAFHHSVHVDVTGLDAAEAYHYRFHVAQFTSRTGHTRTLPAVDAQPDRARFVVANCQAYQSGFYSAHAHLAAEEIDLVFFVRDYIYELENSVAARPHGLDPMQTLPEYRAIYTLTHADADLQGAHAAHPWVLTWDDHEVEDNYADLEPGQIGLTVDPQARSTFPDKRAAAYQAWWENVPIRPGPPIDGALQIYRDVRFGDLLTFAVVDNRQYRDAIPAGAEDGALPRPFGGGPQVPDVFDPSRSMLGDEQETWLLDLLGASTTPWNVLVQQSIVAEIDRRPDLDDAGYSLDAWDGYVASRDRILGFVADEDVPGFISVGGDIHTGAVTDLKADYKDPDSPVVGAEFVAPSITSTEIIQPEALAGARASPDVHYYEPDRRGYLLCTVTPDRFDARFRYVTTTARTPAVIDDGPRWTVEAGSPAATET